MYVLLSGSSFGSRYFRGVYDTLEECYESAAHELQQFTSSWALLVWEEKSTCRSASYPNPPHTQWIWEIYEDRRTHAFWSLTHVSSHGWMSRLGNFGSLQSAQAAGDVYISPTREKWFDEWENESLDEYTRPSVEGYYLSIAKEYLQEWPPE